MILNYLIISMKHYFIEVGVSIWTIEVRAEGESERQKKCRYTFGVIPSIQRLLLHSSPIPNPYLSLFSSLSSHSFFFFFSKVTHSFLSLAFSTFTVTNKVILIGFSIIVSESFVVNQNFILLFFRFWLWFWSICLL